MRVLHVVKSLERGGAEVLLIESGRAAPASLRQDYAYFLETHSAVAPDLEAIGNVNCLGAGSSAGVLGRVGELARHLRRVRPDVVHAHLPLAGVATRLAAADLGMPVVYTEHNVFDGYHPATQLLACATWKLQRAVVAVSDSVARRLPHGPDNPRVHVVPNGVPVDRIASAAGSRGRMRAELGYGHDDVVVIVVAVFREAKRLERVVELARRAASGERYIIVGGGPLYADIRRDASDVDEGRLRFLGPRRDVPELLAAADVFLMTSDREGLPVALLEAMAAGLPVVVPDVGGIGEVVDATVGGLVQYTESSAITALEDALAPFLRDSDRRRRCGECARNRVRDRFGVERMVQQLTAVYESLL
jgi:glycosyltransferase involved in cell wall biosynthesis